MCAGAIQSQNYDDARAPLLSTDWQRRRYMNTNDHDEIAELAYRYFEERGGADGQADDDWLRAEEELQKRKQEDAAASPETESLGTAGA
jgi:hypothetical protein